MHHARPIRYYGLAAVVVAAATAAAAVAAAWLAVSDGGAGGGFGDGASCEDEGDRSGMECAGRFVVEERAPPSDGKSFKSNKFVESDGRRQEVPNGSDEDGTTVEAANVCGCMCRMGDDGSMALCCICCALDAACRCACCDCCCCWVDEG